MQNRNSKHATPIACNDFISANQPRHITTIIQYIQGLLYFNSGEEAHNCFCPCLYVMSNPPYYVFDGLPAQSILFLPANACLTLRNNGSLLIVSGFVLSELRGIPASTGFRQWTSLSVHNPLINYVCVLFLVANNNKSYCVQSRFCFFQVADQACMLIFQLLNIGITNVGIVFPEHFKPSYLT